jgi:hypothetical protein
MPASTIFFFTILLSDLLRYFIHQYMHSIDCSVQVLLADCLYSFINRNHTLLISYEMKHINLEKGLSF